ncbi:helix-turn-helix domain-containing protein [Marinobacterium rhizophilum]|uniref:Helix-turn-helix domain-containing protein n=1 Tax=Marinobacterium rhizophilum TaxID=420402 RepID=A0ABY5HNV2_9GAMM|nr:helix-turn-helix domain-containing protein [Marinobacterium rhizophilum]UTW13462.1 helix-turn-helix domain-containing protein [Marinobacterium rhizophilum]
MDYANRSVHRAIQIIELLKINSPLSLEEIHIILDLPKATVFRLLTQMVSEQWLYRYLADGRYSILSPIFSIDKITLIKLEVSNASNKILKSLFQKTAEPSDLAVNIEEFSIVESSFGETNYRMASKEVIGVIPEAKHSSLSKAYMDIGRQEFRNIAYYPRTSQHWEHRFNWKSPYNAIAVPVRFEGSTIGALNIAVIDEEVTPRLIAERYLETLDQASRDIAAALAKAPRTAAFFRNQDRA